MKKIRLLFTTALAAGMLLSPLAVTGAQASISLPTPPPVTGPLIPPPAGAVNLLPGQTVSTTQFIDGKIWPVTMSAGLPTRIAVPRGFGGGVSPDTIHAVWCIEVPDSISWGVGTDGFSWTAYADWCYNGEKVVSVPGMKIHASVGTVAALSGWSYAGLVNNPPPVEYYGGWAYQMYAEGHFHACPIIHIACVDDIYPNVTFNVYGSGGYGRWISG